MPAVDVFLDSNVLLYLLSDDPKESPKRDQAAEIIATEMFGTSYQVLMETWVVATRKFRRPVAPEKIAAFLEQILVFPCVACTESTYQQAFEIERKYRVHPYDAAILAAAIELGAGTVYSEDMSHGMDYGGVTVINPFLN